mmetsp:Transcript_10911/g.20809  ORF Transcript_10911/g.20809 Transcript_10911/m.20809 type:complete len:91 (+) Transcript_10911:1372-1644(+)
MNLSLNVQEAKRQFDIALVSTSRREPPLRNSTFDVESSENTFVFMDHSKKGIELVFKMKATLLYYATALRKPFNLCTYTYPRSPYCNGQI